ncbi:PIG-L family deacetylase [Reichenbachiella sp. MSK19-1]|uniref:PIG-L family deacetylase n=1 Tax=Reichenbachiella sp. MSK19-1 TaxID=1897631 RepID=UPI000E6BDA6A|nr:PIG-L family deacetylase [Reichenbachiella sp. MSK19-1]RJE74659.1 LmbE family protein [Reichenbachiella sp. MSK19-1]
MKLTRLIAFLLVLSTSHFVFSQKPKQPTSAEILHRLQKLNVLGSALYVAAHPDDENTRLITYLANEKHFNTAYLSATRGDGGQNLVGSEIRESLGVIRTQELLAARRTDGGQQYFSRANDFGYSKTPEETFNIWDRDQVLSDFVRVFRQHKPDVVITRFPEDGRGGHGHHTASAILAREAFSLAADPNAYPESAQKFGTWQAKRLVFNTHPYFFRGADGQFHPEGLLSADLGGYNPMLGKSYTEIAAESRSMHKSQGFGTTGSRGVSMEYFLHVAGDSASLDLLEGVDQTWTRVTGGDKVGYHIDNALMHYDAANPTLIISDLVAAYNALSDVDDKYWVEVKGQEIKDLIKACAGLYLEAKADVETYNPGDSLKVSIEAINRSDADIELNSIDIVGIQSFEVRQQMHHNRPINMDKNYQLKSGIDYSQPYWLKEKGTLGMYKVSDENLIGKPENDPALQVVFTIKIGETYLDYKFPVVYKKSDPVDGEVYEPVVITTPIFTNMMDPVAVFANGAEKEIQVKVIAGTGDVKGKLRLELPAGWKAKPKSQKFALEVKDQESIFSFVITPPTNASEGVIQAVASVSGQDYSYALERINYDHIPKQTLFPDAVTKVVNLDLKKKGNLIGYIEGAGDDIPASLAQIGYKVDVLDASKLTLNQLTAYDAVIVGIRAFNTQESLKFQNKTLMSYVNNGGTLIVQYNTSHRLVTEDIAPYPLKLSRDRVSVEEAEVRFLKPQHELLNSPNVITEKDFDNWTQERGLYFPNEWDDHFEAILSANDPGETPKDGGLLVTQYGKGYYIYTGYSWFRELPAGVPGAYRIYTNMISIGK